MSTEREKTTEARRRVMNDESYGFEMPPPQSSSSDEADARECLRQLSTPSRTTKSDLDLYKSQVTQVISLLKNLRMTLHHHVHREDFQEHTGIQDIFDFADDIRTRVDARDTVKPPRNVGPTDDIPKATVIIVDDREGMQEMLAKISCHHGLGSTSPRFFISCAGDDLGRQGKLTLLVIYIPEKGVVYLIDILVLGNTAFSAFRLPNVDGSSSVKSILEDEQILLGIWDCRSVSEALFAQYDIKLAGIVDIQLLDVATKKKVGTLGSMEACFTSRLNVTEAVEIHINETDNCGDIGAREGIVEAKKYFEISQLGVAYQPTQEDLDQSKIYGQVEKGLVEPAVYARPIEDPLKKCWAHKVLLLPSLYHYLVNHQSYSTEWASRVSEETEKRLELSWDPKYEIEDPMAPPSLWPNYKKPSAKDRRGPAKVESKTSFISGVP